jgi:hypothetical protein
MKLKGEIVDRMRTVLGGKTPTEKRIRDLLAEVEGLRAEGHADRVADSMPVESFLPPIQDGEEIETPPVDRNMAIMMATIANLEAKVTELSKPRTAEEKDEAIGLGRLPVAVSPAAPLGYSGSAQLPRGEWFVSPFGPKIKMKLCGCPQCSPFRLQHYFCVTCQRGPIDYQQHNPQGRKIWLAPGATWGVSHECCQVVCYMRYMESIGVVAGVNDHQAPGQQALDGPERPVMAVTSD